jgi:hypothetical protein
MSKVVHTVSKRIPQDFAVFPWHFYGSRVAAIEPRTDPAGDRCRDDVQEMPGEIGRTEEHVRQV